MTCRYTDSIDCHVASELARSALDSEYCVSCLGNLITDTAGTKETADILYLCDRRACEKCSPECRNTPDIRHAKNFEMHGSVFMEKGLTY